MGGNAKAGLRTMVRWLWWSWVCICTVAVAFLVPQVIAFAIGSAVGLLLLFWFLTLVHELGHAVAAWLSGWRVHEIAIWPLLFQPRTRAVFWRRTRPEHLHADLGGWVYATPSPLNLTNRGDLAVSLGGAVANLALAAICLFAADALVGDPRVDLVLWFVAGLSTLVAVINMFPRVWKDGARSDGQLIFAELRRRKRGEQIDARRLLSARVAGDLYDGAPIDPLDVAELRSITMSAPTDIEAEQLSQPVALQVGDLAWLRELILRQECRGVPPTSTQLSALALASAVLEKDGEAGMTYLNRIPPDEHDVWYLRGLVAVEYVLGRQEAALHTLSEIRRVAGKNFGDKDDHALFAAIERGLPLPRLI